MRYLLILFLAQAYSLSIVNRTLGQPHYDIPTQDISFETSDGITIYGDLAMNPANGKTIVLFHQGGSNVRGEYQYALPVLYNLGFNVMAVDLRSGGERYGSRNRTVDALPQEGVNTSYCDAENDIQSAIDYATSKGLQQLILFGSSYSGSLVIRVGSENKDLVSGIVAFSPSSGGPMAVCRPDDVLETLKIPLLVFRPDKEMAIESVARQFQSIQSFGHQTYIAKNGVHGSSLLVPDRIDGDVNDSWEELKKFLRAL